MDGCVCVCMSVCWCLCEEQLPLMRVRSPCGPNQYCCFGCRQGYRAIPTGIEWLLRGVHFGCSSRLVNHEKRTKNEPTSWGKSKKKEKEKKKKNEHTQNKLLLYPHFSVTRQRRRRFAFPFFLALCESLSLLLPHTRKVQFQFNFCHMSEIDTCGESDLYTGLFPLPHRNANYNSKYCVPHYATLPIFSRRSTT